MSGYPWLERSTRRILAWPLRARMAMLLVVASLLPLVISAYFDIRQTQDQLLDAMKSVLQARDEQVVLQLDEFHRGRRLSVERLARFPETLAFCSADARRQAKTLPAMERFLFTFPGSDASIGGVALLDHRGHVLAATNPAVMGTDLSFRPYVRAALQGNTVVSDIFLTVARSGEVPSIAYAAPMRGPDQQVACVALLLVRATALWQRIKAANGLAGPGSFAVMFDSQGIRIGHTYSDDIVFHPGGRLEPAVIDRLVAEQRFGTRTRALLEDVRAFPEQFERARSATPDLDVFHGFAPVNQTWNYGVARRFETVPWTLFYMVPEADVQAQIALITRQKVLLALAIMAAALLVGLSFSAGIVRRIRALGAATSSLAAGDLAARVQVGGNDELGRLGDSFNAMAERIQAQEHDLRQSRDELEQRVVERTAELTRTAERLQAEGLERQRAEAAIRESQELLQAITDNTSAVIYVKDLQGRYLMVNRRYSELFHISNEAIIGRSDAELFPAEVAAALRSVDQRVAAADVPVVEEESVPHDDGLHTYISVKCPLRDREGSVHGIFGISTDITDRKQAEAALRASDEHTRLIVDTALDAVVSIDAAGVITGWTPQAESTFGWTREEALGRELARTIVPPAYRESHRQGLLRYQQTGEATVLNKRLELTALHRDGHEFPIELSITPIRRGSALSFSAFVRDITDRKHAEARLQAQLERLNLLDQITCAIGERQDLQSIYQVAIRSLEERLPVDFSCVCRYDPLDNVLRVTCVGVHSEALAMALAMPENATMPIDENGLSRCIRGHVVYEPDVEQVAFPFPQRLLCGGLHSLVMAPLQSESQVFGVLVAARHRPGAFSSGECEFLRQLSAHVALAAKQAELHDSLQRAYDDLRQTQQAVMQQERLRALGQMASGIAHDINNAISPVMLYTESLLEREPNLSTQARSALENIARAIDDVAATVARMREFYRSREPELALAPLDLNRLVQQVAELTRARWGDMPQQRGVVIQLRCDLADQLPVAMGVESEIREALINLVFNAVDAMPEGGELTLRTSAVPASSPGTGALRTQVEVVDTGLGMDEPTRRRCLEPFFTTKGERGTGLGLAMVYGAVQRHGADIDIRSAVGEGTGVTLRFPPAAPGAAGVVTTSSEDDARPPRLRILVVDDDPLLLRTLRDTLEADGHVVVTANAGQAGIDAFHAARARDAEAFTVVMTDLGMPYVDGRKVASAVKRSSPGTPVILLTGWGQRLIGDGDIPEHVDEVLSKPPKLRELRMALSRAASNRPPVTQVVPMHILVVDDDPIVVKVLQGLLEFDKHNVVAVNAGQAGIDAFRQAHAGGERFDLVITDLGMPHVDGRQVAEAIKQTSPMTPVIMLTGWGAGNPRDLPPNVDLMLGKPPILQDLRQALADFQPSELTKGVS